MMGWNIESLIEKKEYESWSVMTVGQMIRSNDQEQAAHKQTMSRRDMQMGNQTQVTEFLILGFSDYPDLQILLFVVFLCIYLVTLMGNFTILTLMFVDSRLHKPMYFFLINLAILDVCLTSCTLPKMLSIFLLDDKAIPFLGCIIQLYLLMSFTGVEFYLLTAMAYDRYVAICNPLRYSIVMNKRVCALLSVICWVIGLLDVLPHSVFLAYSSFCRHNVINHLFCDFRSMLQLSCSDTSVSKLLMSTLDFGSALLSLVFILVSYSQIFYSILRMQSVKGRYKAFSTCSSHLMVVSIYSGGVFFVYLRPTSKNVSSVDKLIDSFYNTVIPMLNPIIYSLRNKDIKAALKKLIQRRNWIVSYRNVIATKDLV
ncbi:olfactory receptor 1009-like [Microcaecilia unicolor]|uniref:Olfactory receptor n=1 Tax=Microcaecilia unicolor TaxID=1415580 RepID=A0A6P7WNM1_9AMPH|nr:olfactory receptor 1009-like [Microcaecilia unicolor]